MSTKRVTWLTGGLSIPGVGMTVAGKKSAPLPTDVAEDLVAQGIASDGGSGKVEQPAPAETKHKERG